MGEIIIPINGEIKRFEEYLMIEGNNKILFSGLFGSGKTYFLNKYFTNNEQYESFFISPINYSISRNEDIFEYIKYDIAFQLLGKEIIGIGV